MEDSKDILFPTPILVRKNTSWGAIIAILIILGMIVVGAFYAWGKRISEQPGYAASLEEAATSTEMLSGMSTDIPNNTYEEWSTDSSSVFFKHVKIGNLDAATFSIISPGVHADCPSPAFVEDANGIYTPKNSGWSFDPTHPETYVFEMIPGADVRTFKPLSGGYSRDAANLYLGAKRTGLSPENPANYDTHCG